MVQEKQRTLKQTVTITGKGLHSGQSVTVKILPAPPNHWCKFIRVDLANTNLIEAVAENVVDTLRCTNCASQTSHQVAAKTPIHPSVKVIRQEWRQGPE